MGRLDVVIGTEILGEGENQIRLGHTFYEYSVLKEFVFGCRPRTFVEIGVHEGGLSYLLLPKLIGLGCSYMGVELDCSLVRPKVKELYAKFSNQSVLHCIDCFDLALLQVLMFDKPNKIIYCDGGHKAIELLHFKSACNSGDIIMTHDFYDEKRKVRGVPDANISKEVLVSDIQHMENDKTFERLDEDIFKETRIIGWRRL